MSDKIIVNVVNEDDGQVFDTLEVSHDNTDTPAGKFDFDWQATIKQFMEDDDYESACNTDLIIKEMENIGWKIHNRGALKVYC